MADEKKDKRETYTTNFYKADIDKVSFLGSPHMDNVVTTLMAIGNELWTNRKRIHVLESVMAEKGVTSEMVEKYEPTEDQKAAWLKEREVLVERLYAHFARDADEYEFTSDWEDK
ncbi:MAG: hypothetical protein HOL61_00660 [Rhodospirillaceae bacterium]|jgi:hypothetical protein|nr:hypothetical protein [Rhodospirillaceae bacterium]MBT5565340.1 hypothetical protein [Rhodospirillaceae bacterium]MBT6960966.1 hypothetical protein [Rhodospirillaceae bacterium]